MINTPNVIARIESDFEARIAEEDDPEEARQRICKWLSGVSYEEWFHLVSECEGHKLLGKALEMACADLADGDEVQQERLVNAYIRGATADVEDDTSHEKANQAQQYAYLELSGALSGPPPAEIVLRGQLEKLRADKDWSIDRLRERIASQKKALEDAEQVLGSLPRIARTDASKRALAKAQAILNQPEVETR